jgi:hypothetical protein
LLRSCGLAGKPCQATLNQIFRYLNVFIMKVSLYSTLKLKYFRLILKPFLQHTGTVPLFFL